MMLKHHQIKTIKKNNDFLILPPIWHMFSRKTKNHNVLLIQIKKMRISHFSQVKLVQKEYQHF